MSSIIPRALCLLEGGFLSPFFTRFLLFRILSDVSNEVEKINKWSDDSVVSTKKECSSGGCQNSTQNR